MKPQIEIEIKAELKDKKFVEKKLKQLGARYIGKKHQIDYYFSPPHMSYGGKGLYFRIRHDSISMRSRLEYHISKSGHVGEEYEIDISDHRMALKILELLDFKPEVTIEKVRDTYQLRDVTIDLDKVKNLGNFIEIEILDQNPKKSEEKILEMAARLGISQREFSEHNYFNQMYELRKRLTL